MRPPKLTSLAHRGPNSFHKDLFTFFCLGGPICFSLRTLDISFEMEQPVINRLLPRLKMEVRPSGQAFDVPSLVPATATAGPRGPAGRRQPMGVPSFGVATTPLAVSKDHRKAEHCHFVFAYLFIFSGGVPSTRAWILFFFWRGGSPQNQTPKFASSWEGPYGKNGPLALSG